MYKTGRKITFLTIAMAFFFLSSCKEEERKAKYVVKNEIVMPESWYIDLPKEKKIEIKEKKAEIRYRDNVLDIYSEEFFDVKKAEEKKQKQAVRDFYDKAFENSKKRYVELIYNNRGNSSIDENKRIEEDLLLQGTLPVYEMQDKNYFRENTPSLVSGYPVDRSFILTQDRFIPVILKNDLNSQIPSEVTFQVTQDVFGSDGRYKLLEKGDQVIGRYKQLEGYGYTRLNIDIIRIIRLADGAHLYDSDEPFGFITDSMGRTGLTGEIDTKLAPRLAIAAAMDAYSAGLSYVSSLNNKEGDNVSVQLADNVGDATQDVVKKYIDQTLDLKPVMSIAGGELAYVRLLKDIYLREPKKIQ